LKEAAPGGIPGGDCRAQVAAAKEEPALADVEAVLSLPGRVARKAIGLEDREDVLLEGEGRGGGGHAREERREEGWDPGDPSHDHSVYQDLPRYNGVVAGPGCPQLPSQGERL